MSTTITDAETRFRAAARKVLPADVTAEVEMAFDEGEGDWGFGYAMQELARQPIVSPEIRQAAAEYRATLSRRWRRVTADDAHRLGI